MINSSSLPSASQYLPNSIDEKLDDSNYLQWKQVEHVLKSHILHQFVVNPVIPPRSLSDDDRASGIINPAYEEREVQDQILLSLLQSKISKSIFSFVCIRCGNKIQDHFFSQTKASVRQLCTDLHPTSLNNKTVREVVGQIKSIADELAGIECPIKHDEYVDAILEGLSQDYAPVISVRDLKSSSSYLRIPQ